MYNIIPLLKLTLKNKNYSLILILLFAGMISVSLEEADLYGVSIKMSIDEKVEHFSVSKGLN